MPSKTRWIIQETSRRKAFFVNGRARYEIKRVIQEAVKTGRIPNGLTLVEGVKFACEHPENVPEILGLTVSLIRDRKRVVFFKTSAKEWQEQIGIRVLKLRWLWSKRKKRALAVQGQEIFPNGR